MFWTTQLKKALYPRIVSVLQLPTLPHFIETELSQRILRSFSTESDWHLTWCMISDKPSSWIPRKWLTSVIMPSSYLTTYLYRSMKSSFNCSWTHCVVHLLVVMPRTSAKVKIATIRILLCVRRIPWWHGRCTYRNAQRRRDTAVCFCQLRAASNATIRICHAVSTGRLFFSSWHGGQLRCHWSGTHWVRTWWCWQVHPTILSLRLVQSQTIFLLGSFVVASFRASAQG